MRRMTSRGSCSSGGRWPCVVAIVEGLVIQEWCGDGFWVVRMREKEEKNERVVAKERWRILESKKELFKRRIESQSTT